MNPIYAGTQHYDGTNGDDVVAPQLRQKVNDNLKDDLKVIEIEQKQQELKTKLGRPPMGGGKA